MASYCSKMVLVTRALPRRCDLCAFHVGVPLVPQQFCDDGSYLRLHSFPAVLLGPYRSDVAPLPHGF